MVVKQATSAALGSGLANDFAGGSGARSRCRPTRPMCGAIGVLVSSIMTPNARPVSIRIGAEDTRQHPWLSQLQPCRRASKQVRRPSSTAASTCDAFCGPMKPATRRKSSMFTEDPMQTSPRLQNIVGERQTRWHGASRFHNDRHKLVCRRGPRRKRSNFFRAADPER